MTNNFDSILGRGGFGTVYHGFIGDIQVAVKMLSLSSVHGYQQFVAEVKLLMRVHHRNLTSLIGYCNEETNIGLIYEYMANRNLDEHLFTTSNRLTEKSDVYSFGVALLRIITSQAVIMVREDMIHHISQRVNSMVAEGDITKIVDSRLQGDFNSNSAWRVVEIAMASASAISVERPYMSDIVKEPKECLAAELARKYDSCELQNEDLGGQGSLNLISSDMTPLDR
nr:probable LRR receptor-like serine/threonine-protein kinase At1g51880 [Arachis hypogaea]